MEITMRTYKRFKQECGSYFFTLVLENRYNNDLLIRHVDHLRAAFRHVQKAHPFVMDAVVVMPEHLHCIWQLPDGDDDFSTRWRLIKSHFSRSLPKTESLSNSRKRKNERGIWQRRFWEHAIRDDKDYAHHVDYIHYNPVKHGLVSSVKDWEYSSFHRWVGRGLYPVDWTAGEDVMVADFE